tara:strand:+ start:192 stop:404 length:213 start_codon:yes stop_codon:yes gene_type:complete
MIKGLLAMKSKRQRVKEEGTKKKYQLPQSWNEWAMIIIFLSIIWFAWGQFQFDKVEECCEGNQCTITCSK